MNFNDNPERLKIEEQEVLDHLLDQMNQEIKNQDSRLQNFIKEANNTDISINPDLYASKVLARKGIKNTFENRKKYMQARDELYHTRLLLQCEDDFYGKDTEEIKVGLHSCTGDGNHYVLSWKMPVCRHYMLDNGSIDYENITFDKERGKEYCTKYKLLIKNQVTLRFTRVKKAMNMFPGVFDDNTINMIKGTGFMSEAYLDEMIKNFNPDEYNPEEAAKIISDEFLQELLERRSTPEFKNIVFSIQKKQGEIIQATYSKNMIVQGCAGSGKSMIMLHRLPILLYDNPDNLKRTSLYVISPSQMYIQLASNMRHQLEISDIEMGTIEEYYDYCISKYPGHKPNEYGRIHYGLKMNSDHIQYVYSSDCRSDINEYFENIGKDQISLEKANLLFNIQSISKESFDTCAQRISARLLQLQNVIKANDAVLNRYFKGIRAVSDELLTLSDTLWNRRRDVIREITKAITKNQDIITGAKKRLLVLNPEENAIAIKNCYDNIDAAENEIKQLTIEIGALKADNDYFAALEELNKKVETVLEPFLRLKNDFQQNTDVILYDVICQIGQLIGGFYMLSWECSKIEDKYQKYLPAIKNVIIKAENSIKVLQNTADKYLDFDYYSLIKKEHQTLAIERKHAIKNAYEMIMKKIGIVPSENGSIRAISCSPYIYLQVLYCYQGSPARKESLLAIDEAQSLAPEEIRLLKNINGNKVIFNLYGDIYQHIEGTKGVDVWDAYKEIIDFDYYELMENYRNASQITDYCNRIFHMNMNPINTPGKGVHELENYSVFCSEIYNQLMDTQRAGLSAILVSNDKEARYLLDEFSDYSQKFNDMTGENFTIHLTRWNIIKINDAKGLEFSSVIVLSGRMSKNEKYIAYTRSLDDLYIYPEIIDITRYEKKKKSTEKKDYDGEINEEIEKVFSPKKIGINQFEQKNHSAKKEKNYQNSEVRDYFVDNGLEVLDMRDQGGRLWVIGEKDSIRSIVNQAISRFGISGKYTSSKEIKNKKGWCTKTDK